MGGSEDPSVSGSVSGSVIVTSSGYVFFCCLLCIYMPAVDRSLADRRYYAACMIGLDSGPAELRPVRF